MEHIAAIMMLIGCTQADTGCRELPAPAVGFETVENCETLLVPSVNHAARANGTVYGKCVPIDPALYLEDAVISWKITSDDQLDVSVDFAETQDIAANETGAAPKTSRIVY